MKKFIKQLAILSCLSLTIAINCADSNARYNELSEQSSRDLKLAAAAVESVANANVDLEAGCLAKTAACFDRHGDKIIAGAMVAATPCMSQVAGPYTGIVGSDAGQLLAKIFLTETHKQKMVRHGILTALALLAYYTKYATGSAAGFDYLFVSATCMSLYFHAVDIWEKRNRR